MKVTLLEDLVCPCGGELELTRVLESKSQDSWVIVGEIRRGDQRIAKRQC